MVGRLLTALALLTATAAADSTTPHCRWTRAAIGRLPVATVDRGRLAEKAAQLDALAEAMATESQAAPAGITPRQWVAVLGSIGFRESTFSLDVQAGICRSHQCDARKARDGSVSFLARSSFQLHNNKLIADSWERLVGVENTAVQVAAASRMAKVGHYRCAKLKVPFPASVFRGFAGSSCSFEHKGEKARAATYNLLLSTAMPKAEAS